MSQLSERAVLMKVSAGLPGASRKDKRTTAEVKVSKGLGEHAGRWIADLYPEGALDPIKSKQNEARAYHNKVTFPFGVPASDDGEDKGPEPIAGIGILPAALIGEYGETMRRLVGELDKLASDFLADPAQWVNWAQKEHNGTFDPKNYPGCSRDAAGLVVVDADKFREVMRKRIYLRTEPLPIPGAEHFSEHVTALLGVDCNSVNVRVGDAEQEAQRELMRRLMAPIKAMAAKLAEAPKSGKDDIIFRDTLIDNVKEIVALAPKLNMAGDVQIDSWCKDLAHLFGGLAAEDVRKDKDLRGMVKKNAEEMIKRLEGYKL